MRIKEIIDESSSCGATSSGAIAIAPVYKTNGNSFFGGDPSSSIYGTIKNHRVNRKKKVIEELQPNTYIVKWQVEDTHGKGLFAHSARFQNINRQELELDIEDILDKWLAENYDLNELSDVILNYRVYLNGKRTFEGKYNYITKHEFD